MTEPYMKLTCETRFDNGKRIVRSIRVQWDTNMGTYYDTCRLLALAIGYHPDNVKEYFEDIV